MHPHVCSRILASGHACWAQSFVHRGMHLGSCSRHCRIETCIWTSAAWGIKVCIVLSCYF